MARNNELIVKDLPKHSVTESIKLLRTNLTYLCRNKPQKVYLITSAVPNEGKSWTAANLAVAFAQTNQKVLLIDADMRKGVQAKIFGKSRSFGLSNYLETASMNEVNQDPSVTNVTYLSNAFQKTEVENLSLLPSGSHPFNPAELLSSSAFDDMLEQVKKSFDVIIFDTPPVSVVTDALLLCKKVDYVSIVASVGETKIDLLTETKKAIEGVDGKIAGVILNKMPEDKNKYYYSYGYGYSTYYSDSDDEERAKFNKKIDSRQKGKSNLGRNILIGLIVLLLAGAGIFAWYITDKVNKIQNANLNTANLNINDNLKNTALEYMSENEYDKIITFAFFFYRDRIGC